MELTEERCVDLFKDLLRFRTVSAEGPRTGSYQACCDWLVQTVQELIPRAKCTIVSPVEKKPTVVATIVGSEPDLESVVLNAHYDVVPVMEEFWEVDPWGAVEKDGKIYGRGTQDMKCVLMQYILAVAKLCGDGKRVFKRTLHMTFVPDEEIGGKDGMGALLSSGEFERLVGKVGVALDEGLATPETGKNTVFFGERLPMWVLVYAKGPTGHGSRFIKDTAVEKLIELANKAFERRREEEKRLNYGAAVPTDATGCKHCEAKKLGDVMTINLTVLQAGVSTDGGQSFSLNVIPNKAMAGFDIRVPISMPVTEVKAMLDEWTSAEGMSWEVDPKTGRFEDFDHAVSSVDPEKNPWWKAFSTACAEAQLDVVPEIFPAGTDSRFLRQKGIPAFGFSPMSGSPILLHEHNEYLERDTFLKGIEIYEKIIPALADL